MRSIAVVILLLSSVLLAETQEAVYFRALKAEEAGDITLALESFEEAAALAAFYSKGKVQEKVEIDYVQRKEVKKPGGAKPGFVVYYTNYSMAIAPDISALKLISD